LILAAQFRSFLDPFLILLAVPPGLTGVLLILYLTGTPISVMSLMGMLLVVGISVSDSILIVEFINRLPMAAKLGTGSESYAPLARALIGGLAVSAVQTIFLVPSCYLLLHSRHASHVPSTLVGPGKQALA
jgi:multidrug efflux pump subunit AcrB